MFVTNIQLINEFNIQYNCIDTYTHTHTHTHTHTQSAIYLNSSTIVQQFRFSNFITITISIHSEIKLYCANFHCDDFVEAPYALQERDR